MLSTPARYTLSMVMAAVATLALFYVIVLLIKFNGTIEAPQSSISVALDTVEPPKDADPVARAQRLQEQSKALKQQVELPPTPATKTTMRNQLRPSKAQVQIAFKPSFDSKVDFDLNMPARAVTSGRGQSTTPQGNSGPRKGFGDTSAIGGDRQCTIIFEVGETKGEIASLQWIDCMNAKIVNAAEAEVYRWVRSADQSYIGLNPQTGDQIEFTYEEQ